MPDFFFVIFPKLLFSWSNYFSQIWQNVNVWHCACVCARVQLCESVCVRGCDARGCKARASEKSHFIIFRRERTCLKKWQLRKRAKNHILLFLANVRVQKSGFFMWNFLEMQTNKRPNKRPNERTNERTNQRTNEPTTWLKKGIFEMLKYECTNERTHKRTNAQTNKRTNERLS